MNARFCLAALGFFAQSASADALVNAGLWETTAQMEIPGVKLPPGMAGAKPMTETLCFTEEDINKTETAFPIPDSSTCKQTDYAATGKRVTFTLQCGDATMKYDATIDSPDAYHGTFVSQGKNGPGMSATFTAKRIGEECPAAAGR